MGLTKYLKELVAETGIVSRDTLEVQGNSDLQGDADVGGNQTVQGNQSVGGNQSVTGQTTFKDNIDQTVGGTTWSRNIEDGDLVIRDDAGSVALRTALGEDLAALVQNGGTHEIDVTGLSGDLADRQDPKNHNSKHSAGNEDEIEVIDLASNPVEDAGRVVETDGNGGLVYGESAGGDIELITLSNINEPKDLPDPATVDFPTIAYIESGELSDDYIGVFQE